MLQKAKYGFLSLLGLAGLYLLYLIGSFIIGHIILFSVAPASGEPYELEYARSFEIVSLKDNSTFVVGHPSSSGGQKLYYMEKRNGKFYPDYQNAGSSSIVESDEKPHVKVYYVVPKKHKDLYKKMNDKYDWGYQERYEFHVPKGSVEMEFKVDSE